MIIVLAVIAILVAGLLIPMIKRLDRIAGQKESQSLKLLSDAFKERILATKYVPGANDWVPFLAAQLGWQTNTVSANERRSPRIYLIDPGMQIGYNSSSPNIPYAQPVTGSMVTNISGNIVQPISPRFMFLSSISRPLPAGVVSGVAPSSGIYSFDNIWQTADGRVPSGWSWPGGEDLKIQRVDLTGMFVQVNLSNADAADAYYAIEGIGTNAVPTGGLPPMYFLRSGELKLLDEFQLLEYTEVLFESVYYTYELGSWQAKPFLGRGVGQPGPLDLQRAMNLFLKAPPNPYADFGANHRQVYDSMVAYMSNFIDWRNAGYPGEFSGGGTPPNNLSSAQTTLDKVTDNFIDAR